MNRNQSKRKKTTTITTKKNQTNKKNKRQEKENFTTPFFPATVLQMKVNNKAIMDLIVFIKKKVDKLNFVYN